MLSDGRWDSVRTDSQDGLTSDAGMGRNCARMAQDGFLGSGVTRKWQAGFGQGWAGKIGS